MKIELRLSNGVDRSVEFAAHDAASLRSGCEAAFRAWRVQNATAPGYREAMQNLNAHIRKLRSDDIDAKFAEWAARGHSEEECAELWAKLQANRKMQESAARTRAAAHLVPVELQIHVKPLRGASGQWLNPTGAYDGARVSSSLALRVPGRPAWGWGDVWAGIEKTRRADEALSALCGWVAETVADVTAPARPKLELVKNE